MENKKITKKQSKWIQAIREKLKNKKAVIAFTSSFVIILGIILTFVVINMNANKIKTTDSEILRSMEYEEVKKNDDKVDGTNFVKFDAFFTRDLDGDGYAEKLRGSCRPISSKDTLYFSINVLTEGYFKDGQISINGENIKLQTAIIADSVVSTNAISEDTTSISLNQLMPGSQKLFSGLTTPNIRDNINDYSSSNNSVTLTGTYVTDGGQEIPISKEVKFIVDWHGEVKTELKTETGISTLRYYLSNIEKSDTEIGLRFNIEAHEIAEELILAGQNVTMTFPELNGYRASSARVINEGYTSTYDDQTGILEIEKSSTIAGDGSVETAISRRSYLGIMMYYPVEAYSFELGQDIVLEIPIEAYHTGYNNINAEFENPKMSNIAQKTIYIVYTEIGEIYNMYVGERLYREFPYYNGYLISKEKPLKIYGGTGLDSKEKDLYTVQWRMNIPEGVYEKLILEETPTNKPDQFLKANLTKVSMEGYTSNVGIYFSSGMSALENGGSIKVYNNLSGELLQTFTKDNISNYTNYSPYYYNEAVTDIRVEIETDKSAYLLSIYHVKQLNDEKIVEDFTLEAFDELAYIESYWQITAMKNGEPVVNNYSARANYLAPESLAIITRIEENHISTQKMAKNVEIEVEAVCNNIRESKWGNGVFVLKFPSEILDVAINQITTTNPSVAIAGYEIYEVGANVLLKVQTESLKEEKFSFIIDCDVIADPRIGTMSKNIELYAHNPYNAKYNTSNRTADIYDINGNGDTVEFVAYNSQLLNIYAPSSLVTSQTVTEYNLAGDTTIAPKVAEVNKSASDQTAKINLNIKNNYIGTISEIKLLGKIPFTGNRTQFENIELGSTFSSKMTNVGLIIPSELEGLIKVYYSNKETPSKDLTDSSNGWTQTPADFSQVKTYLIDFQNYELVADKELTFSYMVEIPGGTEYNKVSYSTHSAYFYLHTEGGKLADQTEVNKVGIRIAKRYDIELTKYREGTNILVPGATYRIKEENGNESKVSVTNINGIATIRGLYVDRVYILKEIASPSDYELDEEEIKFKVREVSEGNFECQIINGAFKESPAINMSGTESKIQASVEDKVKYTVALTKLKEGTSTPIKGISFNLKGKGLSGEGKNYTTNVAGEISFRSLYLDEEYTLTETNAKGYYMASPIKFKLTRNGSGNLVFNIIEGTFNGAPIIEEVGQAQPKIKVQLTNESIPTYKIKMTKYEDGKATVLPGAGFRIEGEGIKEGGDLIKTNINGEITYEGLYEYVAGKNITGIYTIKEEIPPVGYALSKETLKFKAERDGSGDLQITIVEDGLLREISPGVRDIEIENEGSANAQINIGLINKPLFKLTKKDRTTNKLLPGAKFYIMRIDEDRNDLGYAKDINGNTVGEKGIQPITFPLNEDTYPWTLANGVWQSENYDINESNSIMKSDEFTVFEKTNINFQWTVSSESPAYDYLYYTITNVTTGKILPGTGNIVAARIEGLGYGTEFENLKWVYGEKVLEPGTYTISFTYRKDQLVKEGLDRGFVKNVRLEDTPIIETDENGEISAGLQPGLYKAIEVESPTGYALPDKIEDRTYYFGIGEAKEAIYGLEEKWGSTTGYIGTSAHYEYTKITSDGGSITVGDMTGNNYVIPATETVSGMPIVLTNDYGDNFDMIIVKHNQNGKAEWAQNIGVETSSCLYGITEVSNGEYIAVGDFGGYIGGNIIIPGDKTANGEEITLIGNGSSDMLILKIIEGGQIEWAKGIGGNRGDRLKDVTKTQDGGYIATGYFNSDIIEISRRETDNGLPIRLSNSGNNTSDGIIIKYTSSGQIEWAKSVGMAQADELNGVKEIQDDGYIAAGFFTDENLVIPAKDTKGGTEIILTNNGSIDGMIIKYTLDGQVEWAKSIGNNGWDYIYRITASEDGGFVIVGSYNSASITIPAEETVGNAAITITNKGTYNAIIMKYAANGKVEWARSVGSTKRDLFYNIDKISGGGYIIAGTFESSSITIPAEETVGNAAITLTNKGTSENDTLTIKYAENGQVEWAKSIGRKLHGYLKRSKRSIEWRICSSWLYNK